MMFYIIISLKDSFCFINLLYHFNYLVLFKFTCTIKINHFNNFDSKGKILMPIIIFYFFVNKEIISMKY